jgi:hypothetical protein
MNKLRPLAGALLATLFLMPAGFAAEVDKIGTVTEDNASLTGPSAELYDEVDTISTGPADFSSSEASVTGPAAEWPFDNQPSLQTRHFGQQAELTCTVAETPGAIVVINQGPEPLPAGTRIKWQLPGQRGFFALLGPLGAGETLVADNVLASAADLASACAARVI